MKKWLNEQFTEQDSVVDGSPKLSNILALVTLVFILFCICLFSSRFWDRTPFKLPEVGVSIDDARNIMIAQGFDCGSLKNERFGSVLTGEQLEELANPQNQLIQCIGKTDFRSVNLLMVGHENRLKRLIRLHYQPAGIGSVASYVLL